ncbi:hypothetical protein NSQ26_12760 [Bacillus sp. FSL W7-1360]
MKKIVGCLLAAVIGLSGCVTQADADRINHDRLTGQGAFGPGPLNFEHMKDEWHDPRLTNTGTSYKTPT